MLKGAIDHISPNEIGGWIYSATGSLRNHTVLAFLDDVCIGAGRVELYREDLADAGLGDGFLGFRFPVNLASVDEAPLVAVKLEGSDAVIIQPSARLVRRTLLRPRTIVTARTLASIEWMRARSWLDQAEYDFLRMMFRFGIYDLSLRQGRSGEKPRGNGLRDPLEVAQEMFELLCNARTEVATDVLAQESGWRSQVERYKEGGIEPIIAVWSPQRASISLVEGSHQDVSPSTSDDDATGAVEYAVAPDRLLFIDLRCRLKWKIKHPVRCYSVGLG
jgi:hypothetical protein